MKQSLFPSIEQIHNATSVIEGSANVVPISVEWDLNTEFADTITMYKNVRQGTYSVLWECSTEDNPVLRHYSVIATEPFSTITCGPNEEQKGDPMLHLEKALSRYKVAPEFALSPPILNGAGFGYIGYDCVKYFEPRVAKYTQEDVLKIPEALFMFFNTFVIVDYLSKKIKIASLVSLQGNLAENYAVTTTRISCIEEKLRYKPITPTIQQEHPQPVSAHNQLSNMGEGGYQKVVKKLREYIIDGWIIQAVPSQRIARPTKVEPFGIYQKLRTLNPSRYGFFIECGEFCVVGSSPELLVKITNGKVVNHPIAGTRKRGKTPEEDQQLAEELIKDEKERAEHIMLVDLGRNDVNRVSIPETTNVDSLMHIEKFSHVQHIVSQVSGILRPERSSMDAFRSIFPAGTVSGAPKVQAMELVAQLEKEKRGVYAGGVGYFSFHNGDVDTCIAIRTMVHKNGVSYLQAGGGIVYDSDPDMEHEETIHKMAAVNRAIELAESDANTLVQLLDNNRPTNHNTQTTERYNNLFNNIVPPLNETKPSLKHNIKYPTPTGKTSLLIDNYDSFTWNLYQYLRQLGENVLVYRHDQITLEECQRLKPDRVVISPGPGWPKDSGISNSVISHFFGKVPILGVCLGHECLVELYGGEIIHCGEIKHGKTSVITHDQQGVYEGIPNNISVIRYHSLAANITKVPPDFIITSQTANGIIMGIRHKKYRVEGVQFHPESIKTDFGMQMLKNFLNWTSSEW